MTTIEDAIFERLTTDGDLQSLIGNRLYDGIIPHGKPMPRVSFRRISKNMPRHLLGPSPLAMARYQFTCWGADAAQARTVANAIRLAMDGLIRVTAGSVVIDTITHEGEADGETDPSDASRYADYFSRCDYIVKYREEVPAYV